MLVLTGLAGRFHTETLNNKERRVLLQEIKEARAAFNESVSGLSNKQLNYRKAKGQPSIKEYIYQAVSAEQYFWSGAKNALLQQGAIRKNMLTDDCLGDLIRDDSKIICGPVKNFKSVDEALSFFKKENAVQLKYIRTTTENVRVHSVQLPVCRLDAYQLMMMSALSVQHFTQKINELKSSPRFPKKK